MKIPLGEAIRIKPIITALCLAQLFGVTAMAENAFFAMDTGTKDAQHQTAEAQAELVKEIGFAGIGPIYSTPQGLQELLAALDKRQLKLFAEYLPLNFESPDPISPQIKDSINQLKGRDSMLWLCVPKPPVKGLKPSDPAGDALAVPVLQQIADLAAQSGVRVALYPHASNWVERIDDAVRLAQKVNRKNLGVTFNLCHWLLVDGKDLDAHLDAARPWLFVVTINGADSGVQGWAHLKQLIQPLDTGTFDVGLLLKKLKQIGYDGPIGLQHYGIGGDAEKNLRRSMDGWRRLQAKLQNDNTNPAK
jgi:sugar phosphate isomerase/epimerase